MGLLVNYNNLAEPKEEELKEEELKEEELNGV